MFFEFYSQHRESHSVLCINCLIPPRLNFWDNNMTKTADFFEVPLLT